MSIQPRRTKIVCTIGPATAEAADDRAPRRGGHGRGARQLLARHAGGARGARARRARRREAARPAAGDARRPAGPQAARCAAWRSRGSSRAATSSCSPSAGMATGDDLELGFELDFARVVRPGSPVMIDDGRVRLRVVEALGKRVPLPRRDRRPDPLAEGREPAGQLPADPVDHRARPRAARARRALGRRLRRALVRAARRGRRGPQAPGAGARRPPARDRQDREGSRRSSSSRRSSPPTDALMVARGDLGVEIGAAEVPMLQKRLIRMGREAGKPGDHGHADARVDDRRARPTRAEASRRRQRDPRRHRRRDAVAARPPSASIRSRRSTPWSASRRRSSRSSPTSTRPSRRTRLGPRYISDVVGHAACDMAEAIEAAAIIVPTVTRRDRRARSRSTARAGRSWPARRRRVVQRQLMLDWAVVPLRSSRRQDVETPVAALASRPCSAPASPARAIAS